MSLTSYQAKRRFESTPEPRGKPQKIRGAPRFVVQKHAARRVHYDFRLEMDGVLKSWAVPKGPSLNPADKRLAILVEDHPLEYRTFEGIIPAGNYGAGTVMVWDQGSYEPVDGGPGGGPGGSNAGGSSAGGAGGREAREALLRRQLDKGHLRFVLNGQKLRGEFSLVKLKHGKGNEWLFFKHHDPFAGAGDVLAQDRSAKTGRSMEEIAKRRSGRGAVWYSNRGKDGGPSTTPVTAGRQAEMPHRIKPMLATLVDKPFDRAGWLFEIKWDGFRALAEIERGKVRLYSRNLLSYEQTFAPLVRALEVFGHDAVLDGEIVALDAQGRSQFELLQNYQKSREGVLAYYIFDLLYLDGQDLRGVPLRQRKELLASLLGRHPALRLSEHIEERGVAFFKAAADQGLEGIIAKNAASRYREGKRGPEWLKLKARKQQEAVIAGYTEPRGTRQELGALILGLFDNGELTYIGHTGSGFDQDSLAAVRAKLEPMLQKACPFKKTPKTNAPAHWVKPALVCEVAFQGWTGDGSMRHPVFLGLREDRAADDVHREVPQHVPEVIKAADANPARSASPTHQSAPRAARNDAAPSDRAGGGASASAAAAAVLPAGAFTNLDKIYWPDEGYTKGDMLRYYHQAAPWIVPYLRDRPLNLNRHPNGIRGQGFFHKDMGHQPPPAWVRTAAIHSESRGKEMRYLVCQDEATLLYVANLGCIEMNPWHSRVESLERPDYLIIDLDPQDVPFAEVVTAAQEVRKLLEDQGVECCCKTSGKRGLHVYVPLGARYAYDQARRFAEIIATLAHTRLPHTTSMLRSPAQRRQRIYLDYLQNRHGQTIAAPYSVRPVPGATVSTPLRWQEVGKKLDPAAFTIATIQRRLDRVGDLWKPVLGRGVDLEKCLSNWQQRRGGDRDRHPSTKEK
ncbi:MAG: DNA ligase D [Gemmataceae bacterium]|nr:DNA ligase D [Gemmataceae bacterium]